MNRWTIMISLMIAFVLAGAVLAASDSLSIQEIDLAPAPGGYVYEANLGADGLLYVSDFDAKQIWRVDPTSLETKRYQFAINVADARADASGNIWFTDGATSFARSNAAGTQAVSWDVAVGQNLNGTAFTPDGKIWFTDWWINADSHIFSFDTTELCTYTLPLNATDPAGSQSWYIVYGQNKLWIANRFLKRIYSIETDPAPGQATYWQIDSTLSSSSYGLAMDKLGQLWWADEGLNALVSLDTSTTPDKITRYNLPNGAAPYMLTFKDNVLWFSAVWIDEERVTHGYLGSLVPNENAAAPITITETGTYPMTRECDPEVESTDISVSRTDEDPNWIGTSASQTVDTPEWQIYELPAGALPFAVTVHENYLWATDQGRQKLMRVELPTLAMKNIYLPLVIR